MKRLWCTNNIDKKQFNLKIRTEYERVFLSLGRKNTRPENRLVFFPQLEPKMAHPAPRMASVFFFPAQPAEAIVAPD